MPIYRPDPRAYLQLNQGTQEPKLGQGTNTLGGEMPKQYKFTITKQEKLDLGDGLKIYKVRYPVYSTYDAQGNEVLSIGEEPMDIEEIFEKEEPEEVAPFGMSPEVWRSLPADRRQAFADAIEGQLTNPQQTPDIPIGADMEWQWKGTRWQAAQVKKEQMEDPFKGVAAPPGVPPSMWNKADANGKQTWYDWSTEQMTNRNQEPDPKYFSLPEGSSWQYDTINNQWTAVKAQENDQTGTSLDERVEYSPDKSQQRTYVTSRDKTGKVTRQYTSEWTPTPTEPETPEAKFAREQAERDAINNPRNLSAALAYLSKNPLPTARQLPDNGLDYGPQGGYTPEGLPISQLLSGRIAAQGTGANLIRVFRGSEMTPDVVRQGTDEYNFLTSNNLGQLVTTQSIVDKLPWNQQQVDSMTEAERVSLGTLLSSQGIDPSELPDLTRRNVAFWNQAHKEQQDERLNRTPAFRNALAADSAARVAPYLREQEARKQGSISSALRGTGRRRYR